MARRAKTRGPDLVFIKLQDVLAKDGCPICRVGQESTRRFLWGYLYERVNDPISRRELVASRGFCARHAWALGQFQDTLGVAILYRHLLQELNSDMRRTAAVGSRRARAVAARLRTALRASGPCPAYANVNTMEDSALHALVTRLDLPEVWDRVSGPSGLCLPHFLAGLALADERSGAKLVQAELTVLAAVGHHLDELIRKYDYRFSAERMSEEEGQSWVRAIELLVGRDPIEDRAPAGPWDRS